MYVVSRISPTGGLLGPSHARWARRASANDGPVWTRHDLSHHDRIMSLSPLEAVLAGWHAYGVARVLEVDGRRRVRRPPRRPLGGAWWTEKPWLEAT
jgi:hypothetical protein